ncbi:tripartite tricarboxylate transporter TctB family protein [Aquamicrobium terrae]|uniref:DUF1468 domain-containing protein n=1 Tax=Aquamicrobium terrae TaxID=1324945 RepID=A0ABV2N7E4_9HYPH
MSTPEPEKTPRLDLADLVFGIVMLAGSLVVLLYAMALPPSPYDPLGPGAFPKALSGMLAALSLVLIARVLLRRTVARSETSLVYGVEEGERVPLARYLLAIVLAAATVAYSALLIFTDLPFLLLTIVYIAALGFVLSGRTPRDLAIAVAVGIGLGLATDLIFTRVLLIELP